ncbi:MAG: BMP family ABC transporter substrate-binding protein [Clostridia bacterium]|nr:BMP family ABC transporter substrate-binding protein [Clostridia bacterium]
MSRQQASNQYGRALKAGQKYHHACVSRGEYPYTKVLSDVFSEYVAASQVDIGLVDIPMELIVGTTTAGRKAAFAGNFMPLLGYDSEFSTKWINLCEAHLSETGITDPIVCFEYLGYFYITEGNKRVSVLKSYDSPTISGHVKRIMPEWSDDDPAVQVYFEFLDFYQLAGIYDVKISSKGGYAKLQAMLGFEPDHVWTRDERSEFLYGFGRFKEAFQKLNTEHLPITPGDALLVWLQVNPAATLSQIGTDIQKTLTNCWPDVRILANGSPIAVSTSPDSEEKSSLTRMLGIGRINHLRIAFIHAFDAQRSSWTAAHETGRIKLEESLGDRVTVKTYFCEQNDPMDVMEQAVAEGAQVIFATTPPMISACRQIAARHPNVRVLNCSLSMPYAGIRTYYGRIYEAKFITGAIAGAMAKSDRIGYVAHYPIIGSVTAINAFALGARLTNPSAKIVLRWSCVPGNPIRSLLNEGITMISNRETGTEGHPLAWEWGTYMMQEDGSFLPLSTPRWNWGKFYEGVVNSIFNGSWDALGAKEAQKAVNYWWGMSSGVIEVDLNPSLPDGAKQIASILQNGLLQGCVQPFDTHLVDQNGIEHDGALYNDPHELMNMDWLLDNIEGGIPAFDELLPVSQQLVRLLGLHRNSIQPKPEEVIL